MEVSNISLSVSSVSPWDGTSANGMLLVDDELVVVLLLEGVDVSWSSTRTTSTSVIVRKAEDDDASALGSLVKVRVRGCSSNGTSTNVHVASEYSGLSMDVEEELSCESLVYIASRLPVVDESSTHVAK